MSDCHPFSLIFYRYLLPLVLALAIIFYLVLSFGWIEVSHHIIFTGPVVWTLVLAE